jgi:hypothetical protein
MGASGGRRAPSPEQRAMPESSHIRVVIADDHAVTLASLKLLLFFEPDIEVIGSVASATEALALASQMRNVSSTCETDSRRI